MEDQKSEALKKWFYGYIENCETKGINRKKSENGKYDCPCCSYPTLDERGWYNICYLCKWEDDGQDDPYADETWYGPNSNYSLTEARENFKKYLIQYRPSDDKRFQNIPEKNVFKKSIIEKYNYLRSGSNIRIKDITSINDEIKFLREKLRKFTIKEITIRERIISFYEFEDMKRECPCCNNPTLRDSEYPLCYFCHWQAVPDETKRMRNDYPSLKEARDNFNRYFTIYPPRHMYYLKQNSEEIELKSEILNNYNRLKVKLNKDSKLMVINQIKMLRDRLFKIIVGKESKFKNSEILFDEL